MNWSPVHSVESGNLFSSGNSEEDFCEDCVNGKLTKTCGPRRATGSSRIFGCPRPSAGSQPAQTSIRENSYPFLGDRPSHSFSTAESPMHPHCYHLAASHTFICRRISPPLSHPKRHNVYSPAILQTTMDGSLSDRAVFRKSVRSSCLSRSIAHVATDSISISRDHASSVP